VLGGEAAGAVSELLMPAVAMATAERAGSAELTQPAKTRDPDISRSAVPDVGHELPRFVFVTVVAPPSYSRTRTARLETVVLFRNRPRVGVELMELLLLLRLTFVFWLFTIVEFEIVAKWTKKRRVSRASSHSARTSASASEIPDTLLALLLKTRSPAAVMSVVAVGEPDWTKTL